MKKISLFLLSLFIGGSLYADELRPQFRAWKSSALQAGNYSHVLISTTPIILHTVIGSPTVNVGGNSYFVLNQSSFSTFQPNSSTKAFISLNVNSNGQYTNGMGDEYNVKVDSHSFFSKQGGAIVNYLWDYYKRPPAFNKHPLD